VVERRQEEIALPATAGCANWVLSVPKRLRWYLEREPKVVCVVLHIFLPVIESHLRRAKER